MMGRYLFALLVILPPLAVALHHDVISFVLTIGWTVLVLPLSLLRALDFFRNRDKRFSGVKHMMRIPMLIFGLISLLGGVSIVIWCLYNVGVRHLPEYSGPQDALGLWLEGFGVAPVLVSFGWYLLRLSMGYEDDPIE